MIIGYVFKCSGCGPMRVKGDSYEECYEKFKKYWSADYDVDTSVLTSVQSIEVEDFDIL